MVTHHHTERCAQAPDDLSELDRVAASETPSCPICRADTVNAVINHVGTLTTGTYLCSNGHGWITKWNEAV